MKKMLLVLCCLPFLFSSARTQDPLAARVDKVFEQFDKPDSPGCSLAVIKDSKILYKRGYGMADLDHDIPIKPDTVFHVASVSKQFAAMSILLLAKEGKLSLDDEVRKYIPELRDFGPKLTIRHLLHHTSGLRDQWNLLIMSGWRLSEDVVRDEDVLDLVSKMKDLNFKPGDQYMYCNTGYTLAGFIVKKVSGLSLREFSEANIFKPLGMTHSLFRDDHAVIVKNQAYAYNMGAGGAFKLSVPNYDTVGASSLVTSVEDLAEWDRNFYDKKVGGEATINLMQTPGVLNDGEKIDYALGVVVGKYKGLKVVEHSGADAGYRSHLMRFPEQRFSVACLCNYGGASPNQYARRVADVYLEKELQPEPEKVKLADARISESDLKTLPGAYWNSWTEESARISAEDGKLRLAMQGLNGLLLPGAANQYRIADQPFEIEFDRASESSRRMLIKPAAGKPAVFEAMPPAKTSAADLAEFAGDYYSDEIDSIYKISIKEGKLTLSRKKSIVLTPQPVFRDAFSTMSILGTIRFTRDAQNRVDGFKLSAGRIRGFKFVKQK
jgi:CubicO group peptidase (beta-lactamase class C family)